MEHMHIRIILTLFLFNLTNNEQIFSSHSTQLFHFYFTHIFDCCYYL